jgi:hypothetical protein
MKWKALHMLRQWSMPKIPYALIHWASEKSW